MTAFARTECGREPVVCAVCVSEVKTSRLTTLPLRDRGLCSRSERRLFRLTCAQGTEFWCPLRIEDVPMTDTILISSCRGLPGADSGSPHLARLEPYGDAELYLDRPGSIEEQLERVRDFQVIINTRRANPRTWCAKNPQRVHIDQAPRRGVGACPEPAEGTPPTSPCWARASSDPPLAGHLGRQAPLMAANRRAIISLMYTRAHTKLPGGQHTPGAMSPK